MKKLMSYFQVICIDYALIILLNSIFNLFHGLQSTDLWNVENFIFTVLIVFLWNMIAKIDFKHNWTFYLSEGIAIYALILLCGYFFGWFSFEPLTLAVMTVRSIIIGVIIVWILNQRYKAESDQINELIKK